MTQPPFNRRLTGRGENATAPARLPALQPVRTTATPAEMAKALEALREWVEVRLGSRGDRFERAVTMREFEQRLKPLEEAVAPTFKVESFPAKPATVTNGGFVEAAGKLYFGVGNVWKEVPLT